MCKKLNGENQFDFKTLLAEIDDSTIWEDETIRCAVAVESSHYPFFEKTLLTFACIDTTIDASDDDRIFCDKLTTGGFSLGLGIMYDIAHGKKNAVGDYTNGYAYFKDRHSIRIADVYGCSPQLSICLGPCPLEGMSVCNFYVDGEAVGGVYKPFSWGIGLNLRVFHTGTIWRRVVLPVDDAVIGDDVVIGTEACDASCFGYTCDLWVSSGFASCGEMESSYGCSCAGCVCEDVIVTGSCDPTCISLGMNCDDWVSLSTAFTCGELESSDGCNCAGCSCS